MNDYNQFPGSEIPFIDYALGTKEDQEALEKEFPALNGNDDTSLIRAMSFSLSRLLGTEERRAREARETKPTTPARDIGTNTTYGRSFLGL